jgi:hypothetical protein
LAEQQAAEAAYEYRTPIREEQETFSALRGDPWEDGVLSRLVKQGAYQWRHVGAAMLWALANAPTPITFGYFIVLVEDAAKHDATPKADA